MEREREGCGRAGGGGEEGGGGGPVRVLVVDDSPLDRRIVERLLLRSKGMFQVTAVDSGKKAMEVLRLADEQPESPTLDDRTIDLILTDYCMPEMNGYELLKAIKENNRMRSIPIVIMSSENNPQRISSCCASGAEEFILKPLKTADLQRLWSYARPMETTSTGSQTGNKRKMPLDIITEDNGPDRQRPRLEGVAVA